MFTDDVALSPRATVRTEQSSALPIKTALIVKRGPKFNAGKECEALIKIAHAPGGYFTLDEQRDCAILLSPRERLGLLTCLNT